MDDGVASVEHAEAGRAKAGEGGAPLLLEREHQLEQLTATLEDAGNGVGRLALIEGPAGIGKSRLMQAACEKALVAGFNVRTARATELDHDYPFGLVRQLFEPVLAAADPAERDAYYAGAAAGAEAVFDPDSHDDLPPDPGYGRLHALYWLTANLADRRPLVLAFDDLHWGDPASRRFVSFLATRLDGVPALLLITSRPPDSAGTVGIPREVTSSHSIEHVLPGPLSDSGVATAVRAKLGRHATDEFCDACAKTSGGNPFYLSELVRALPAGVLDSDPSAQDVELLRPSRIASVVLSRIKDSGSGSLDIARSIAVLGEPPDLTQVAKLADADMHTVERSANALVDAEILESANPPRFVHPLIRSSVLESIQPADRSDRHLAAARLAHEAGSIDGAASQLLGVTPHADQWVAETLMEAAIQTVARGEPELAEDFLNRALMEDGLGDGLEASIGLELGKVELSANRPDAAIERLRTVSATAPSARLRGMAAANLAMALVLNKRGAEMVDVARAALEDLGGDEPDVSQMLHGLLLLAAIHSTGTRERTRAAAAEISRLAEPGGPPALMGFAAFERGFMEGKLEQASALAASAIAGGVLEIAGPEAAATHIPTLILIADDRHQDADEHCSCALSVAQSRGSSFATAIALGGRATARLGRGDLLSAEADAKSALELVPASHQVRAMAATVLMNSALERGDLESAKEAERMFDPSAMEDGVFIVQPYLQARGNLALLEGNPGRAGAVARELETWESEFGTKPEAWVQWRPIAAQVAAREERADEAISLIVEAVEAARMQGSRKLLSRALVVSADIIDGDGIKILEEAVGVLAGRELPLEAARAKLALGRAYREAGDVKRAREELAAALELAAGCQADQLVTRASAELVQAGAKPRRVSNTGAGALTPAERRVAELAAGGASNPEIAQALFVTRKTVETHMGSIFRKLDISSRVALASKLGQDAG